MTEDQVRALRAALLLLDEYRYKAGVDAQSGPLAARSLLRVALGMTPGGANE